MVFSNTTPKTPSILKVVEIDRLKAEKSQQVSEGIDVVSLDTQAYAAPPSPVPGPSFTEEFLKTEPAFESKMYHELDSEFFQDLGLWCSTPDKEAQTLTIDKKVTEERANNTTLNTQFSPQGWDGFDAKSPLAQTGFYTSTPREPLSPYMDDFVRCDSSFPYPDLGDERKNSEQFLDISSLPVVIGGVASEDLTTNTNQLFAATEQPCWTQVHDETTYTNTTHTTMPFIDEEDSLGGDTKCITWSDDVLTNEVECNDVVISEYVINHTQPHGAEVIPSLDESSLPHGLKLDVAARAPTYSSDPVINTPDVLCFVEQMEKENFGPITIDEMPPEDWEQESVGLISTDTCSTSFINSKIDYEPVTPKTESHIESDCDDMKSNSPMRKRRHDSEDSDETYTPYLEKSTPRKYKRRKPSVPIKDMILALEGSQQQNKARRGRPPKRRESVVSSVCSVDDNTSSTCTQEYKYRELRDKNNEASKRSRMNRKLKELQMEQLATELEERNKKLKVRADILEDMTKKLKESLMTAILKK